MLIIQFVILLFILFAISRTVLKFKERKIKLSWFIFWILFWLAVAVAVLLPDTTSFFARFVGITRGADLVIYVSIIVLFYLVFKILVKIESLEQEITKLVRKISLKDE